MSTKNISNNFISFDYSRNILPNKANSLLKKIAKVALIICTLGAIFLVTGTIDVTNSIKNYISKLFSKPKIEKVKPEEIPTTFQKTIFFAKKFYKGASEGFSLFLEIPKTTYNIFNMDIADKKIVYTFLAGYILSTAAAMAIIGGNRGFLTAVVIHIASIGFDKLNEKALIPLEQKSRPIITGIKEKIFYPLKNLCIQ